MRSSSKGREAANVPLGSIGQISILLVRYTASALTSSEGKLAIAAELVIYMIAEIYLFARNKSEAPDGLVVQNNPTSRSEVMIAS